MAKTYTKTCMRETPNLSTNADSSTNIFVSAGVKKGAPPLASLSPVLPAAVPKGLFSNKKRRKKGKEGETASSNDVHFVRVLMPRWETSLLPWDLLGSPRRIAWEGDNNKKKNEWTLQLLDQIGLVGKCGENGSSEIIDKTVICTLI